jgi:hypothetical protein
MSYADLVYLALLLIVVWLFENWDDEGGGGLRSWVPAR